MIKTEEELFDALDETTKHLNALKKPVKELLQSQRVFSNEHIGKRHQRLVKAMSDIETLNELYKVVGKTYIKKITKQ